MMAEMNAMGPNNSPGEGFKDAARGGRVQKTVTWVG